MKKWMILLFAVFLAAGCSNDKQAADKQDTNSAEATDTEQSDDQDTGTDSNADSDDSTVDQEEDTTTDTENETTSDDSSDEEKKNSDSEKKSTEEDSSGENSEQQDETSDSDQVKEETEGLEVYRPDAGVKKTFSVNGNYEVTYDITAENEKYVQRIIHLGASSSLQILHWNKDKVSVVYEIQNPEDTSSQLQDFEAYKPPELLISLSQTGSGDSPKWEIVAQGETVKVPYGEFDDVYVTKQTNTSDNGKKTVRKAYYAPGMGLVKKTTDVSGDKGYHAELVLTEVSE